jgi:hypothetical protein
MTRVMFSLGGRANQAPRGGALSHQIREELCFQLFQIMIELKQTEDQPKMFDRDHILVFFRKLGVVSVCFGLIRNSSVCFGCFDIDSKHRNKPKILVFGFTKQTETQPKQILFRFVSVRTENIFFRFEDTLAPTVIILEYTNFLV